MGLGPRRAPAEAEKPIGDEERGREEGRACEAGGGEGDAPDEGPGRLAEGGCGVEERLFANFCERTLLFAL